MAKKAKTVFVCQECGYESPKWMGQCICGAWNTMVEEKIIDVNEDDKRSRSMSGIGGAHGARTSGGRAAGHARRCRLRKSAVKRTRASTQKSES